MSIADAAVIAMTVFMSLFGVAFVARSVIHDEPEAALVASLVVATWVFTALLFTVVD